MAPCLRIAIGTSKPSLAEHTTDPVLQLVRNPCGCAGLDLRVNGQQVIPMSAAKFAEGNFRPGRGQPPIGRLLVPTASPISAAFGWRVSVS